MSKERIVNQLKNEDLKILTDIKSECEKINKELIGLRDHGDGTAGDSKGLVENTTVRELLEQISAQVKMLASQSIKYDPEGIWKHYPASKGLFPKIEFGKEESTGDQIRSETDDAEQAYLLEKITNVIISRLKDLVEGASIVGKTAPSILQSITYSYALVVQMGNHLDVNLQNLEHSMPAGISLDLPQVVESGTMEALLFSSPNTWMNGLFSYDIVDANLRLVIFLQQNSNYLAVALAPSGLPIGNYTFVFEGGSHNHTSSMWKTMAGLRWTTWSKEPVNLMVWNGDILVRVVFAGGPKSLIEIDICSYKLQYIETRDALFHRPKSISSVVDGKTIVGKSIAAISEYFLDDYGYILEFVNLLHVSLNEPQVCLENGQQPFTKPEMVSGGSKEVLVVKMDNSGKGKGGLATFRIGMTDLRLAVAFQLLKNGNKVATAFVSSNIPTDTNLMLYLTSDDQWSTNPDRKLAMAKDGDLVIQTRNIRARVSMTEGLKAVLNIVVKTC